MKTILVTGASGFIGCALASALSKDNKIIGLYNRNRPISSDNITWVKTDLLCIEEVKELLNKFSPDIIIHCAAIAHQGIFKADKETYFEVNSKATVNIALAASELKNATHFIFLSSISVYGETNLSIPVSEFHFCRPTSDYGKSKLDAENRLLTLYKDCKDHALTILRLAPVYDKEFSFNLDRRVLMPFKLAYVKYGSGKQRMSAIARSNLIDFVRSIISKPYNDKEIGQIINVTDKEPYSFNDIIDTLLKSKSQPTRPIVRIPKSLVLLLTRIIGLLFPSKKEWIYGCYEKLASSLIFDNKRMLEKGFKPKQNLRTIFL